MAFPQYICFTFPQEDLSLSWFKKKNKWIYLWKKNLKLPKGIRSGKSRIKHRQYNDYMRNGQNHNYEYLIFLKKVHDISAIYLFYFSARRSEFILIYKKEMGLQWSTKNCTEKIE